MSRGYFYYIVIIFVTPIPLPACADLAAQTVTLLSSVREVSGACLGRTIDCGYPKSFSSFPLSTGRCL
jgi:hypothetical protein